MRFAVAALVIWSGIVPAADVSAEHIVGAWNIQDSNPTRVFGPIVISEKQISWVSEDKHRCTVGYHIASEEAAPNFPGGLIKNDDAGVVYATFKLELEHQDCERDIAFFTIAFTPEQLDLAHFAAFSAARTAQGWGAIRRSTSG